MRKFLAFFLAVSLVIGPAFSVYAQTPTQNIQNIDKSITVEKQGGSSLADMKSDESANAIEATADNLEYFKDEKKIVARGNVVVIYEATKLTADYAEVYTDTKKAYAQGHVIIYNQGGMLRGEKVFYNFKTHQGSFPNGTAAQYPWYAQADQMDQVAKDKVQLYNARLTTCPLEAGAPHYEMTAKRAVVYPGDRMIAYDVKFKILGQTVFWLPYLDIPLDYPELPFMVQPGYSSQLGWYLLTSKKIKLVDGVSIKPHLDWYSKRGVGAGIDTTYGFESLRSEGFVKIYGIQDRDAPVPSYTNDAGENNPYEESQEKDRYRLTWKHRTDFDDYSNLILQYHKFSDEFFLQDFFEKEFRSDTQPPTYLTFNRNTERSGFYVNTDYRTNKFFDETQALPEARFDWNNQRIGRSKLFYANEIGLGNFNRKYAYSDQQDKSWRVDNLHRFSMPLKVRAVQILPEFAVRETYYSDSVPGKAENRLNLEGGIDFKTQYSKIYDWSGNVLGMEFNKMRHIFEPTVGYHDRESIGPKKVADLFQYDHIDQEGRKREAVIGMENRLQTKRMYKGSLQRVDVVSLNTYLFLNDKTDRDFIQHAVGFTNLVNNFTFRPYDWLFFELTNDFNTRGMVTDAQNFDMVFSYKDRFSILFGQRYLRDRPEYLGSNQLVTDINYRLNSRWEIGGYVRAELDMDQIQEWELRMTRDLSCGWFLEFGVNIRNDDIRNNSNGSNNMTLYARMTLVPLDMSYGTGARATFAEPKIGDRVAGGESSNFSRDILGRMWYRDSKPNYDKPATY